MVAASNEVRVEDLAAHPHLIEQVGFLRWNEWAYGDPDPTRFVEVSRAEAGDGAHLPLTLVAVDASGKAVGVVGLGTIDSELDEIERATRTPWILGMVVASDARRLGVGRLLLTGIQEAAVRLGHSQTWVATGEEAVGFYARCGWEAVESLRLRSTGINTTILVKPTRASDRSGAR